MTTKLIVDLASFSESPGCSSIFVHIQVTSESPGIASSSSWHIQRENTLLQHTLQHKHTTSRQRLSYCVSTVAARLGIPGSAYRVYWHSCLIACSIVHSVRANPQSLSLFLSQPLYVSLSLSHSSGHQTYYPHSYSTLVHSKAMHKTSPSTQGSTQSD